MADSPTPYRLAERQKFAYSIADYVMGEHPRAAQLTPHEAAREAAMVIVTDQGAFEAAQRAATDRVLVDPIERADVLAAIDAEMETWIDQFGDGSIVAPPVAALRAVRAALEPEETRCRPRLTP